MPGPLFRLIQRLKGDGKPSRRDENRRVRAQNISRKDFDDYLDDLSLSDLIDIIAKTSDKNRSNPQQTPQKYYLIQDQSDNDSTVTSVDQESSVNVSLPAQSNIRQHVFNVNQATPKDKPKYLYILEDNSQSSYDYEENTE